MIPHNYPTVDLNPILAMMVNQMVLDIMLKEDDAFVVNGYHIIIQPSEVTVHHLTQFTPSLFKKIAMCVLKRYPTRIKGCHILNMSTGIQTIINMGKRLFTTKMLSRIHSHQSDNLNELHNIIPKSSLPVELGGDNNVYEIVEEWKKKIESYRDWFLEDEKYCSEECKRIGKPNRETEFFEMEGSFRKLEVD